MRALSRAFSMRSPSHVVGDYIRIVIACDATRAPRTIRTPSLLIRSKFRAVQRCPDGTLGPLTGALGDPPVHSRPRPSKPAVSNRVSKIG